MAGIVHLPSSRNAAIDAEVNSCPIGQGSWGVRQVRTPLVVVLAVFLIGLVIFPLAPGGARVYGGPGASPVYVVYIHGSIEPGLAAYVSRALNEAREAGARAVLFEFDTFGGKVDAATEIRDMVLDLDLPTIAFVKARAWSAGALLAIACQKLVMAPGSSIGAAETIPAGEKNISALRGEFEATAEARGRDPKIAAAMVDADVEIKGLIAKGKILTLSAEQAKKAGFIDAIAGSPSLALERAGIQGALMVPVRVRAAEKVARFVTDPVVSSLLLALGFLGLLAEITTPGWGVPGTAGIVLLALFFGGRIIAGIAGWGIVLLFLAGAILLMVEMLFIPGFGITGISGIALVLASLFMSFQNLVEAATVISIAFATVVLGGIVLIRRFGRSGPWGRLILRHTEAAEEGYVASDGREVFLGATGRTLTVLRPAGVVQIGDRKLDAISEGEYIPKGVTVQVIEARGARLVVRPQEEESE